MSTELTTQYLTPDQVYTYHKNYPEVIRHFYSSIGTVVSSFQGLGSTQARIHILSNSTVQTSIAQASSVLREIPETDVADKLSEQLDQIVYVLSQGHSFAHIHQYIWSIIDALE